MGTPSWLYYLFAIAMLAVAAYGLSLLVLSVPAGDAAGRDVDISHLLMGVAMAGMFVARWSFGPRAFWETAFFVLMVWFAVRSALSIQRRGVHLPHEAIHAVMSLAMLLMFVYPMGASSAAGGMSMSSSSHAALDPGVGLLLALAFFASAIFTFASPEKGVSHHGHCRPRPAPAYALGAAGPGADGQAAAGQAAPRAPSAVAGLLANPQLEDLSHVVMCVGMGFMLILML